MNVLFLADWHNHTYNLPKDKVDLLIILGDFDWKIVDKLDKMFDCEKLGLLGNHDRKDTYRGTKFVHLHKKIYEIEGFKIAGFDGCPRYNFRETAQFEEEEVEEFTNKLEYVDIFISHSNPMLNLNNDKTDAHRGFMAFTKYIQREVPRYFVHGHNHIDDSKRYGQTNIISVYPYYLLEL